MDHGINLIINKIMLDGFSYFIVSSRFLGAMSLFPIFATNFLSKILKILIAFAFALIIFPAINTAEISNANHIFKFFFIFKEYFIGFIIGFIISIPIWVIIGTGKFIDNQRGESMGSLMNPIAGVSSSSTGSLLLQSFIVYFLSLNGLLFFVEVLYKSFQVYPVGKFFPIVNMQMLNHYVEIFCSLFTWFILLAMPVIIFMFLIEVVLGLLSTFLPQMNVTVLSLPIKGCIGILILILYINNLYQFVLFHFLDKIKGVYV